MKHADRILAFLLGVVVSVATIFSVAIWQNTYPFGFATSKEIEDLRARISGLDGALRESEKRIQTEIEKSRLSGERRAEEAARKSGDIAVLKAAQEAGRRAEEEAKKQGELVKQREAAATKAREDMKKAQEKARAEQNHEVPGRGMLQRSERERQWDEEAARKALARRAQEPVPQETAPKVPKPEAEPLYQQAVAMEQGGNAKDAIRIYRRAARAGSGKAAKRLGEIFDCGVQDVARDYSESLAWYETARELGEQVETAGKRSCPAPRQT